MIAKELLSYPLKDGVYLRAWCFAIPIVLSFFLVIDFAIFRMIYSFTDVRGVKSHKIELDMRRAQKGNMMLCCRFDT